ncbi:hypothetical protein FG484_28815, partial [Burkholderia pseudomallei]|nr:hypothetical protein [Burkholderia pseudomallei]
MPARFALRARRILEVSSMQYEIVSAGEDVDDERARGRRAAAPAAPSSAVPSSAALSSAALSSAAQPTGAPPAT